MCSAARHLILRPQRCEQDRSASPAAGHSARRWSFFAEIYHGATGGGAGGTGKRVFSVNLEGGATEIAALDLNAVVAPMTAHVRSNTLAVTDGNLDIDFSSTVDQAKISAIEIVHVR